MDQKETRISEPASQVSQFNLRALSDAVFRMPTELLDRTLETALRKPPSEVRDRALARLCRRFAGLGQDSQAIKALKAIKSDAWQWNTLLANVLDLGADAFDQAVSLACELYRYYLQGSVAMPFEWDQMQISDAIKELLIRQALFGKADLAWQNRSSFEALEGPYFRLQSLLAFTTYLPVELIQTGAKFRLDEDLELSIDAAAYFSVEQLDLLFNQALKTDRLLDLAPVIQFLPPGQADAVFSAVIETGNFYKVDFQAWPPEMLERLLAVDKLDNETLADLALCKPVSEQALRRLFYLTPINKIHLPRLIRLLRLDDTSLQQKILLEIGRYPSGLFSIREYLPHLYREWYSLLLAEALRSPLDHNQIAEYLADTSVALEERQSLLPLAIWNIVTNFPPGLTFLLRELAPYFADSDVAGIWTALHTLIPDPKNIEPDWLLDMARSLPFLPQKLHTPAAIEIYEAITSFTDSYERAWLLDLVAPYLPEPLASLAREQMIETLIPLSWADPVLMDWLRTGKLSSLAANHLLGQAMIMDGAIWGPEKTNLLAALSDSLDISDKIKALTEALRVFCYSYSDHPDGGITFFETYSTELASAVPQLAYEAAMLLPVERDNDYFAAPRYKALAFLAPQLAKSDHEKLALQILREFPQGVLRANALVNTAPHFSQDGLAEAWLAAEDLDQDQVRLLAEAGLAGYFADPHRQYLSKRIVQTAGVLTSVEIGELVKNFGDRLPAELAPDLLTIAQRQFGPFLGVAEALIPLLSGEYQFQVGIDALAITFADGMGGGGYGGVYAEQEPDNEITWQGFEPVEGIAGFDEIHAYSLAIGEIAEANRPTKPDEKVVNTGFSALTSPAEPLDTETSLAAAKEYLFWLEVGELVKGTIEITSQPLPVEHLPQAARLIVALFPFENEILLSDAVDRGELELTPGGAARVIRQPAKIDADKELLERRLFFPVRTNDRTGLQRLRCNIYCQGALVQSRLIEAQVTPSAQPFSDSLKSTLDYTLSHSLNSEYLTGLEPRTLNVMLNANGDGTHSFRFMGAENFQSNANFTTGALQQMITIARKELRKVAWAYDGELQNEEHYRYPTSFNPKDKAQLISLLNDLRDLAKSGYKFYSEVITRLAGGVPQARRLASIMIKPGLVDIALKADTSFILPAALIYDYKLDTNLTKYTACLEFIHALESDLPLEECRCFQGDCPSRDHENIICPSGFWGFRHKLGLPPSIESSPDLPNTISSTFRPEFLMIPYLGADFTKRPDHEKVLRNLPPGSRWDYAASREQAFDLMRTSHPQVVYFYCHGGLTNELVPFLQIGQPNEPIFTKDNLLNEDIYWEGIRPLVFINGCHTTAVEPETAFNLVSGFVELSAASGVIGTEITIIERLASAFAEPFFRRFLNGEPAGEAIRRTRLELLKQGNPLGLVYIPFLLPDLHLSY